MVQMARPRGEIMAIQETEKVLQSEKKKKQEISICQPEISSFFPALQVLPHQPKRKKPKP